MVIKMLTKPGKRMNEHSEHIKRELENIIMYKQKTRIQRITELRNTLEAFNSRLHKAAERITELRTYPVKAAKRKKRIKNKRQPEGHKGQLQAE